jgi:hypothetical protein
MAGMSPEASVLMAASKASRAAVEIGVAVSVIVTL